MSLGAGKSGVLNQYSGSRCAKQTAAGHLEPSLATDNPPDSDGSGIADQDPGQTRSAMLSAQHGDMNGRLPSDSHPAGSGGVPEAHSGEEAQQSASAGRRAKRRSQVAAGHRSVCIGRSERECRAAKRRRHSGSESAVGERVELSPRRRAKPVDSVVRPTRQRALPAHLIDYDLSCDSKQLNSHEKRCRLACLDSAYKKSVAMQQPLCEPAQPDNMVACDVAQVRSNLGVLSVADPECQCMKCANRLVGAGQSGTQVQVDARLQQLRKPHAGLKPTWQGGLNN